MIKYWVLGGEWTSFGFHKMVDPKTALIEGPFNTRQDAESAWKRLSEEYRPNAKYRFVITEER